MNPTEEGFPKVTACKSENVYGLWYNAEQEKLIVQFKKGLAMYRYSRITQAMVEHMEGLDEGLGSYIRKTISSNPEAYPVEKLT